MRRDDLPISARLADLGYTHEKEKSVWIDGVHSIKESATGRVLREMDALEAACFCLGVEEAKADRDRLRSELDAARAELARVRRAYIRQIERRAAKHCDEWAQVIRSMGCWDPGSYQGRRLTRIRKVRDACRAELARMGEP